MPETLEPHPRSTRRWLRRVVLVVLVLLVAGVALAIKPALDARKSLEEARGLMETGRAALLAGDVEGARPVFIQARSRFDDALEEMSHPLLRLGSFLPIAGRTVDTVEAVSEAGAIVAKAATITTSALHRLSRRAGGFSSGKGAVPIEPLVAMAPAMEQASDLIEQATLLVRGTESELLLGPVSEARTEFLSELNEADRVLDASTSLVRELPEFLGEEGPRRYFFGAQNPAELRGTGGLIGAYSILTLNKGRLNFGPFEPIQDLKDIGPGKIPPPNPAYSERYDRFGGNGFWLNINMTPDFPSAATAIERLYAEVEKDELDGTIVADPFALRALLAATGPVAVEGTDVTLTAENVIQVLSHDAYSEFTDPVVRKAVLGDSASLVFQRFLEVTAAADPAGAARTLIQVVADGNVQLHDTDPEIQRAFELGGAAGKLRDPKGDFLGVYSTNAAANKADFFLQPTISYRVNLEEDGSAEGNAIVNLRNDAPSEGESVTIIGPYDHRFKPGENRTYLSTFCSSSCQLESFETPGETEVIGSQEELGHPVFSTFVNIPSQESSAITYNWTLPEAWDGGGERGTYNLLYQGQNTIRPTRLSLEVRAPEGMSFISATPPLRVNGDVATWRGEPRQLMRFSLTLARPQEEPPWLLGVVLAGVLVLLGAGAYLVARRRARSSKPGELTSRSGDLRSPERPSPS